MATMQQTQKIERSFFSDSASMVAKLAFPSVKQLEAVSPTMVYNARFDGGAIATVAALVHAVAMSGGTREQAEAIVQFFADHVEAAFGTDTRTIQEVSLIENEREGKENDATQRFLINPCKETAEDLYAASLGECAIERSRRALLVRTYILEAA